MITWMSHRPFTRSWISNVIPDLHQPLPPLTYHLCATCGEWRISAAIVDTATPIDQLVDDTIAHEYYGRTFVRQDP